MRKLVVTEWMSLDGVAQAPGDPNEDTSGGFKYGGWHRRYFEPTSQKWVLENLTRADGFLLGRRTYESFASHWPHASEEERPIAASLNAKPKYVVSPRLGEPLEWEKSALLRGEASDTVPALKRDCEGELLVIGSTALVETLIERELVEAYRLMIDPLTIGGGKRIFRDDGRLRRLRLVECQTTDTGAILATYERAA